MEVKETLQWPPQVIEILQTLVTEMPLQRWSEFVAFISGKLITDLGSLPDLVRTARVLIIPSNLTCRHKMFKFKNKGTPNTTRTHYQVIFIWGKAKQLIRYHRPMKKEVRWGFKMNISIANNI
jgi:hypothetical protein